MGDSIWCNITVKVHPEWAQLDSRFDTEPVLPWFMEQLHDTLINGEHPDYDATHATWCVNGHGSNGLADSVVDEVLDRLTELRIPFTAQDEAGEFLGTLITFDGDMTWHQDYAGDSAVLTQAEYEAITLPGARSEFDSVEQFYAINNLSADKFDVSHLPATLPPVTDETAFCQHCQRRIVNHWIDGWIDPEAKGDDVVWRETCDMHDTFEARHEPAHNAGPHEPALAEVDA